MTDQQKILYGSIFTIGLVLLVTLYALYNEGILFKNTYYNDLLGFSMEIPRGYQLGAGYMNYLNDLSAEGLRLTSSSSYNVNNSEVVVITRQDKSKQEQTLEVLDKYPDQNMEQLCDCVVLRPNLMPKQMTDLVNDRESKNGAGEKVGEITDKKGDKQPVYHWQLASVDTNTGTVLATETQEVTNLYFTESVDFTFDNKYAPDQTLTTYGLTLSHYLKESNENVLQKLADSISF